MIKKLLTALIILFWASWASAASFYVDCSEGSGAGDDGSFSDPWNSIADVNAYSFSAGDDVYFKVGTTCSIGNSTYGNSAGLTVDWAGVDSNNSAIIGAYYGDGQFGLNGNDRPIITGNNNPANSWNNCAIYPTANNCGQSAIATGANNYVTVQDIEVKDFAGYGIRYQNGGDYGLIDNVIVDTVYNQGTHFYNGTGNTLQNSTITATNGSGNGAAVYMKLCDQTTIKNNTVHSLGADVQTGPGREGINLWYSDNSLVENNIIYDARGMGIYIDHSIDGIVRYNMIYYTNNTDYWRYATGPGNGIILTDEVTTGDPAHLNSGNDIYGNFIANVRDGIALWNSTNDPALIDSVIYNNTIVKPNSSDSSDSCFEIAYSARNSNSFIKNNICWGDASNDMGTFALAAGITFDYNLWSHAPVDADIEGANDPSYSVPGISKTSGWDSITAGTLSRNDFKLSNTSSVAYNAGADLGGTPYYLDYWDTNKDTNTPWDIGAHEYEGITAPPTDYGRKIIHRGKLK